MMMEEILMDDEDLSVTGPVVLSTNEVPRVSLNSGAQIHGGREDRSARSSGLLSLLPGLLSQPNQRNMDGSRKSGTMEGSAETPYESLISETNNGTMEGSVKIPYEFPNTNMCATKPGQDAV